MSTKLALSSLINKIKVAKEETVKAVSYSEGYLDCIKDMLNDESNDLNKIISVKYDGKVRNEVYSEILPILEKIEKEVEIKDIPAQEIRSEEQTSNHPSDRAKSFLERIGRA